MTLDYPVLKDLGGRTGVDAVWEYMMCIAVEQRFLGKLPASLVREMLMAYHEEYEGLIENLCSILLAGILARIMTEYPSGADNVSDSHGPGNGQHASPGCPYDWKKQQALALLLEKTLKEKLDCDEKIMDYLGYAIPDTGSGICRFRKSVLGAKEHPLRFFDYQKVAGDKDNIRPKPGCDFCKKDACLSDEHGQENGGHGSHDKFRNA